MKAGANKADQVQISKLAAVGNTAKAIAKNMGIDIKVVQSFMPTKEDKK
jgi:hypothetical protein